MRRTFAAKAGAHLILTRWVAVAVVVTLSGCGGGGGQAPNQLSAGSAASDDVPADPAQQAASSLPPSYTAKVIHFDGGPSSASPGFRVINSKGQFVADRGLVYLGTGDRLTAISESPTFGPKGPAFINEDGTVAGTADKITFASDGVTPVQAVVTAFVWRPSTGVTELLENREGAGLRVFLADNGDVGGTFFQLGLPDRIFHFTSALTAPAFYNFSQGNEAEYMNNLGTILASFAGSVVKTISREGHFEEILSTPDPGRRPRFLDDDGRVYLDSNSGATVVVDNDATVIGQGCGALPSACPGANCAEQTRFASFASKGQAVGSDGESYTDAHGRPQFQAFGAFHWSANAGTETIAVTGASDPTPVAVNNAGVVVGNLGDGQAFVWSAPSGGVRLQSLVSDLVLAPGEFLQAIAVGDGGHILASVCCGRQQPLVLLTPNAGPAP